MKLLARVLGPLLFLPVLAHGDPVVHLAWDDCGAHGVATKTFSCGSNAGAEVLVVSFVPPVGIDQFQGIETHLEMTNADGSPLSDWWQLTGCRNGALIVGLDFAAGPLTCGDPWLGQAGGGGGFQARTQRLAAVAALPPASVHALDPEVEYGAVRFTIANPKTAGAGACGGCSTPIGIMLGNLRLDQLAPAPPYDYPSLAETGTTPYVTWQCGGTPKLDLDFRYGYSLIGWNFPGCPTATKRPTWGAVKSLYR